MESLDGVLLKLQREGGPANARAETINTFRLLINQIDFSHNRSASDRSILQVLAQVFSIVGMEKRQYSLSKSTTKAANAWRLSQYGQAIRDILAKSIKFIKFKVIKAFVGHLMDTLPVVRDVLLAPLAVTYLRTLQSILQHSAHLDHFDHTLWLECVEFCISSIENYESLASDDMHDVDDVCTTPKKTPLKSEVISLASCLSLLISWHSADLSMAATNKSPILERLCLFTEAFLDHRCEETGAHVFILQAVQNLLKFASANFATSARILANRTILCCALYWDSRNLNFRQALLGCLVLSCPFLSDIIQDHTTVESIEMLIRLMIVDLSGTTSKPGANFNLTDILLKGIGSAEYTDASIPSMPLISLKPSVGEIEATFLGIQVLSQLMALQCSSNWTRLTQDRPLDSPLRKRRRLDHKTSVSVLQLLSEKESSTVVLGLQIVTCGFELGILGYLDESVIDALLRLRSSESTIVQSWMQVSLASAIHLSAHSMHREVQLRDHSLSLWSSALRSVATPATSRTACHLASELLDANWVSTSMVSLYASQMKQSTIVTGAVSCSDAGCRFMIRVSQMLLKYNFWSVEEALIAAVEWAEHQSIGLNESDPHNFDACSFQCFLEWIHDGQTPQWSYNFHAPQKSSYGLYSELRNDLRADAAVRDLLQDRWASQEAIEGNPSQPQVRDSLDKAELHYSNKFSSEAHTQVMTLIHHRGALLLQHFESEPDDERTFCRAFCYVMSYVRFASCNSRVDPQHEDVFGKVAELLTTKYANLSISEEGRESVISAVKQCLTILLLSSQRYKHESSDTAVVNVLEALLVLLPAGPTSDSADALCRFDLDEEITIERSRVETGPNANIVIATRKDLVDAIFLTAALIGLLETRSPVVSEFDMQLLNDPSGSLIYCTELLSIWEQLRRCKRLLDWSQILDFLARVPLQNYMCERSEALLLFVARFLALTARRWVLDRGTEGHISTGQKMYDWLIKLVIGARLGGHRVRIEVVRLCTAIYRINTDHGRDHSPLSEISTRSSLVNSLKDCDLRVVLAAGIGVLTVFDNHEPHTHLQIFDDVVDSLPSPSGTEESLKLRIFVLTILAVHVEISRILALHRLIEMAHHQNLRILLHQSICVIAQSLKQTPMSLLRWSQRPILWTWLQSYSFSRFPFTLFGFESQVMFAKTCERELVSQLVCQGHLNQLAELCEMLKVSELELLKEHAGLTTVYCRIRGQEGQHYDCQKFLERSLGAKILAECLHRQDLPSIAFTLLHDTVDAVRMLRKMEENQIAARAESILTDLGSEIRASNREPLQCNMKGLIQIIYLSQPQDLALRPPSLMKAARRLIADLSVPASIDVAQSIRKLGLMLCLGGDVSYKGYLPEMILRGLTAFLVSPRSGLEQSARVLMLHIISKYKPVNPVGSSVVFIALVSILRTDQFTKIDTDQLKVLRKVLENDTPQPIAASLSNLLWFVGHETHKLDPQCISDMITSADTLLRACPSTLTQIGKELFLDLIAPKMKAILMDEPIVIMGLRSLIADNFSPISDTVSELVVRVAGASFLLKKPSSSIGMTSKISPTIHTDFERPLKDAIMASLQSADLKVTQCAETAIAHLNRFCQKEITFNEELTMFLDSSCTAVSLPAINCDDLLQTVLNATKYCDWVKNLARLMLFFQLENELYCHLVELIALDHSFAESAILKLITTGMARTSSRRDRLALVLSNVLHKTFCNYRTCEAKQVYACIKILERLRMSINPDDSNMYHRVEIDCIIAMKAACHHNFKKEAILLLNVAWTQSEHQLALDLPSLQLLAYGTLDEPDYIYGLPREASLQAALVNSESSYTHLAMYSAMQTAISRTGTFTSTDLDSKIGSSLKNLGLDIINLGLGGNVLEESKYHSAWRLERWNLPYSSDQIGPHQALYRTLCTLVADGLSNAASTSACFRNAFLVLLRAPCNLAEKLPIAASILEVEEIWHKDQTEIANIVSNKWPARTLSMRKDLECFEYEPILSARQVVLDLVRLKNSSEVLLGEQLKLLVSDHKDLEGTRIHANALAASALAEKLSGTTGFSLSPDISIRVKSLIAEVLWKSGEQSVSVELLRVATQLSSRPGTVDDLTRASNLLDLGLRSSSARLQKPLSILQDYLVPAIDLLESNHSYEAGAIHLKFASFCDDQLKSLSGSEDFTRLERLRNEKSREIAALDGMIDTSTTKEEKRRLISQRTKATALFEIDDTEYSDIQASRQMYLRRSIKSFLAAFSMTDEGDVLISRCLALWFANGNAESINSVFGEHVDSVPSYKFLVVLDQLMARLNASGDSFQTILAKILSRLVQDHPFHSLYGMYAVQYSRRSGDEAARGRVKAITKIVQSLATQREMELIISNVRSVCSNYVKLANMVIDKKAFPNKAVPFSAIPNHRAFLVDFARLQVPPLTLSLPPRPSCDYSDIPTIVSYENRFTLASGISVPKVLKCKVSDGSICKELVKGGNDDLRQDVVMQQVFAQVDELFRRNRATAKRNLKIRTYKVLPLATNAGVLEWVLETMPLQDFLQPLHERYNLNDWSYSTCRKAIADAAKKSRLSRIETYKKVTMNCKPAMKHAFMEIYRDAQQWYVAQLAYTRSTAAISIVGYVLGLGDRHLHNILIDKSNGEVVHIDLGIAFEQGRTLPIPELVPFRLTRDVVDGMGVMGVEGVFRRGCEFTLEVMRSEQGSIKSILDVLRQDPLYSWTLSPLRKLAMQEKETESSNLGKPGSITEEIGTEADRALLVVEKKLSASLSTSAVVNELIQEATDPENLALIFAGWSAWY